MLNRQYNRTIRWINRAQSRSADGNFSDAILDVECARAELDNARQELLLCHQNGGERKRIMSLPLAALTACVITLFLATPTRMQTAAPTPAPRLFIREETEREAAAPAPATVYTVTVEASAAPHTDASAEIRETAEEIPQQAAEAAKKIDEERIQDKASKNTVAAASKPATLSDKDVYRLVEVGRSALRQKNDSVVLDIN